MSVCSVTFWHQRTRSSTLRTHCCHSSEAGSLVGTWAEQGVPRLLLISSHLPPCSSCASFIPGVSWALQLCQGRLEICSSVSSCGCLLNKLSLGSKFWHLRVWLIAPRASEPGSVTLTPMMSGKHTNDGEVWRSVLFLYRSVYFPLHWNLSLTSILCLYP